MRAVAIQTATTYRAITIRQPVRFAKDPEPRFTARRKKREGSGQGSGPGAHAQKGSEGLSPERFPEPEPV